MAPQRNFGKDEYIVVFKRTNVQKETAREILCQDPWEQDSVSSPIVGVPVSSLYSSSFPSVVDQMTSMAELV
jgi:hypothetical protein